MLIAVIIGGIRVDFLFLFLFSVLFYKIFTNED